VRGERFGFIFEGGLDFVFERPAGGGTGFGGVCEVGFDQSNAFLGSPESRDFCERCMAGDEFRFALEVADDGIEVGVLGDDVEIAAGISCKDAAELQGEHEVERVATVHRSLDDAQLLGMILGEEKE